MMAQVKRRVTGDVRIGMINEQTYMQKNSEGHIAVNDLIHNENEKRKSPGRKQPRRAKTREMPRRRKFDDLPPFLLQAQMVACKCSICEQQLKQIRVEGLNPPINDLIEQTKRFDEFMAIQQECNEKMQRVGREYKEKEV